MTRPHPIFLPPLTSSCHRPRRHRSLRGRWPLRRSPCTPPWNARWRDREGRTWRFIFPPKPPTNLTDVFPFRRPTSRAEPRLHRTPEYQLLSSRVQSTSSLLLPPRLLPLTLSSQSHVHPPSRSARCLLRLAILLHRRSLSVLCICSHLPIDLRGGRLSTSFHGVTFIIRGVHTPIPRVTTITHGPSYSNTYPAACPVMPC